MCNVYYEQTIHRRRRKRTCFAKDSKSAGVRLPGGDFRTGTTKYELIAVRSGIGAVGGGIPKKEEPNCCLETPSFGWGVLASEIGDVGVKTWTGAGAEEEEEELRGVCRGNFRGVCNVS